MRSRWLLVAVTVAALVTIVTGPAMALPDNKVEFIRGQGSDTTYVLMTKIDAAFNNAVGCSITGNVAGNRPDGRTSNPDSSCTPPALPGAMNAENWDHDVAMSFYPIGSGNGLYTLEHFGSVDSCGGTVASGSDAYPHGACAYLAIDYARSSSARPGSGVGFDANLRYVAYARDGIAPGNFSNGTSREDSGPAHGATNLTQQQVKDIFINCKESTGQPHAGSFPRWSDYGGVGGTGDSIIVWGDQSGSGTRKTWDGFLGSGANSTACIPGAMKDGNLGNGERVIFENDPTPIRNCATYANGSCATGGPSGFTAGGQTTEENLGTNTDLSSIYPMSFGVYNTFPPDPSYGNQKALGIDLMAVDGIPPTATTIGLDPSVDPGAFPYGRYLFNVYRNTYSSNNVAIAAKDYIGETGWICKGSAGAPDNAVTNTDTDLRGGHIADPATGVNYAVEISNVISNAGFVPLAFDNIGGGVTGKSHCRVS